MPRVSVEVENVGQALLEMLRARGIDFLFGNASTSIIDGLARLSAQGRPGPRAVMVPHEQAAVAMAHGYFASSGRMQAAIVYSTVGTANALGAIINASRARVPMLVLAARSALSDDGATRGARDIHVQWAQESFDQGAMVREYVKWDYELRGADQVEAVIDRAFERALDPPQGPVYLSLPRDVLARPMRELLLDTPSRRVVASRRYPDPACIEAAAGILASARHPLIVTSEVGRDPAAVAALVDLCDAGAIRVIEASPVYANFPATHPSHAGYVFGSQVHPDIKDADAILVIDCDVPWFPARSTLPEATRVIQLGVDPFFGRYPMRNYRCDVPIAAEPAVALPMLAQVVRQRADGGTVQARRAALEQRHRARRAEWLAAALAERDRRPIGFQWASHCIAAIVDEETVVVNEYPLDPRSAPPAGPGRYFGPSHAGGLGWGLGAALGVRAAAPERTVIAALGDGSYIFSVPTACHLVARAQDLPLLTLVFNNGGWDEVAKSTLSVHPDGWAASSPEVPMVSLAPSPRFEELVRAFDGHGERVEHPEALPAALDRALHTVRGGRQALVNIVCRR